MKGAGFIKTVILAVCCIIPFIQYATPAFEDTLTRYGRYKKIPQQHKQPILKALSHFPELKEVRIIFRLRKQNTTFTTRPKFTSYLKKKGHRSYHINISNETRDTLIPLLFENLPQDAQVGVIGHELSHVVDFNSRNFCGSMQRVFGHLSNKYLDRMEFDTDRLCIEHGMGDYLLAYSRHIRKTMKVKNWRGSSFVQRGNGKGRFERYMNPGTIEKHMRLLANE